MKLSQIKKSHADAEFDKMYLSNKGNSWENKKRVVAQKQSTDIEWIVKNGIRIPQHLIDIISNYKVNSDSSKWLSNGEIKAELLQKVLVCRVVNYLQNILFYDDKDENKVIFEDVLVLQPLNAEFEAIRIYVKQSECGHFQSKNLERMIGQEVATIIYNLYQVQQGTEITKLKGYGTSKNIDLTETYDEYVCLGSIDRAEYMTGRNLLIEWNIMKDSPQSSIHALNDIQIGRVIYKSENGIFLLSNKKERVFIQNKDFSYKYLSKVYNDENGFLKTDIKLGDEVQFKFKKIEEKLASDDMHKIGITSHTVVILGERLSLETEPKSVIKSILSNGSGTIVSGHIVQWNSIKGHFFEPDGGYGYRFRLIPTPELDKSVFINKMKLSVKLGNNISVEEVNEGSGSYLKLKVNCRYISSFQNTVGSIDFYS